MNKVFSTSHVYSGKVSKCGREQRVSVMYRLYNTPCEYVLHKNPPKGNRNHTAEIKDVITKIWSDLDREKKTVSV